MEVRLQGNLWQGAFAHGVGHKCWPQSYIPEADYHSAASLRDLYIEQLQDLYSVENQLVKALPKLAKGAASPCGRLLTST